MDAPNVNVQSGSQEELAEKLRTAGHDYSPQIISEYTRNRVAPDGTSRPRVIPPPEFLAALDDAFGLTDGQWEDLAKGWLAIQSADDQKAYRRMAPFWLA